jgi:hypothetical protein
VFVLPLIAYSLVDVVTSRAKLLGGTSDQSKIAPLVATVFVLSRSSMSIHGVHSLQRAAQQPSAQLCTATIMHMAEEFQ